MSAEMNWVGQSLNGRYLVRSQLGAGGMGFVLLADDLRLQTPVVLKVPRPAMLHEPGFAGRFAREIRSMSQLAHAHIVRILDSGEHDGLPFAVMQYLSGGSLKDRLTKGKSGSTSSRSFPERPQAWLSAMARTLDYIHSQGYVHRDVKPDNILFDERGHPYLSDFGVAKVLSDAQRAKKTVFTTDGMVLGTPQYMAPEMILGSAFDGRVDQYALAMTLYECLAGRLPFNGANATAIFMQQVQEKATPLAEVVQGMPAGLSEAVARALDKNPKQRFETCCDFARAVAQSLAPVGKVATPVAASTPTSTTPAVPGLNPAKEKPAAPPESMSVTCARCGKTARVPTSLAGREGKCPRCGVSLGRLPAAAPLAVPAPETVGAARGATAPFSPSSPDRETTAPTNPLRRRQVIWIGSGVTLALGVLIVLLSLLGSSPDPNAGQPTTVAKQVPALTLELPAAVELEKGKETRLRVKVVRQHCTEALVVELAQPNEHVVLRSVTIPANVTQVDVTLTLTNETTVDKGRVSLIVKTARAAVQGTAELDYKVRTTVAVQPMPPPMPPPPPMPSLELKLLDNPAAVTLEAGGKKQTINVAAVRPQSAGRVEIKATVPKPVGVHASGVVLEGEETGQVVVHAEKAAPVGQTTLHLVASHNGTLSAKVPLNVVVEPERQEPPKVVATLELAPIMPVTVRIGEEVEVRLKVTRGGPCRGPVLVDLSPRRPELVANPAVIPEDSTTGLLKLLVKDAANGLRKQTLHLGAECRGVKSQPVELEITIEKTPALATENKNGLVWASDDRILKMWDPETGQLSSTIRLMAVGALPSKVTSVAVSPDGTWFVSGHEDKTVRLWNSDVLEGPQQFVGHSASVTSVGVSRDGKWVFSGSEDKTVKLWDVKTGALLTTLSGHERGVISVAVSSDNKWLVTGSDDTTAILWDVKSRQVVRAFKGHQLGIRCVAISDDGKYVATGSVDKTVKLWDASTGNAIRTLAGKTGWISSVAISPDSSLLISGSNEKEVKVWELESGKELGTLNGHEGAVYSVAVSQDGARLLSGSTDRTVKLWNLVDRKIVQTYRGHLDHINGVAFCPDGKFFISASTDRTIRKWEISSSKVTASPLRHLNFIASAVLSADGQSFATVGTDSSVRIWNPRTDRPTHGFTVTGGQILSFSFSSPGKLLVSRSADNYVTLRYSLTGESTYYTKSHPEGVEAVAISPDSLLIVSGGVKREEVKVVDSATGEVINSYRKNVAEIAGIEPRTGKVSWRSTFSGDRVHSVAISSDAKLIACGVDNGTVEVLNASTQKTVAKLNGLKGPISSLAFSPDGLRIVAGGAEQVNVWDVSTARSLFTSSLQPRPVRNVGFCADGNQVCSVVRNDKTVKVWDVKSGRLLRTLEAGGPITGAGFLPPQPMR